MELEKRIIQNRHNPYELNNLITQHKPFILKTVQEHLGRFVEYGKDDELVVGLMAFEESIRVYDENTGKFLSFAENIIKRRLSDYYRNEKKQKNDISSNLIYEQNEEKKIFKEKKQVLEIQNEKNYDNSKVIENTKIKQERSIIKNTKFNNFYKYAIISTFFILIFLIGISIYTYYKSYWYMIIDINPSIMIEYNRFDRVIKTSALNNDGQKIIDSLDSSKNIIVEEITEDILKAAYENAFLSDEQENSVVLSMYVPNERKKENIQLKLNKLINSFTQNSKKNIKLLHEDLKKEDLSRAIENNISVGKLKLYDKIKNTNLQVTLEDIREMTLNDIVKLLNSNIQSEQKSNESQTNSTSKNIDNDPLIIPDRPEYNNTDSTNMPNSPSLNNPNAPDINENLSENNNKDEKIENNTIDFKNNLEINKGFNNSFDNQFDNNQNNEEKKFEINIPKIQENNTSVKEKINKLDERFKEIDSKSIIR